MVRKQKFCIFCGGAGLSKEHFWSEWIAPLVPNLSSRDRTESRVVLANSQCVEAPIFKNRPGSPLTKKFRVVCRACNNTWMSQLEKEAASVLTPMINGQRFSILPEGQELFAQWVALKVMVSEHAFDDVVIASSEKRAFRATRMIPSGLTILAGAVVEDVDPVMYLRQTANVTLPSEPEPDGLTKNTSQTSFIVGRLFVTCYYSDSRDRLKMTLNEHLFRQLWPGATHPIEWYPPSLMAHDQVTGATWALNRLITGPNARWRPGRHES